LFSWKSSHPKEHYFPSWSICAELQANAICMTSNTWKVYMSVFWFSGRPVQCSKGKTRITKWSPIVTQLMGSTVMIPCAVTDNAYRQYWKDNFGNVIDTELDPRRKVRKLLARLSKLLHCCQLLIFSSTLKFFENQ